jgi:hypothetical protein
MEDQVILFSWYILECVTLVSGKRLEFVFLYEVNIIDVTKNGIYFVGGKHEYILVIMF